jgi:hypothetical protein
MERIRQKRINPTVEEGVIKFTLLYERSAPFPEDLLDDLSSWRNNLWKLGLIGQDKDKYGGYAFGNVSMRCDQELEALTGCRFLVSGTQTGHLSDLASEHYAGIKACNLERNTVMAIGPVKPSSEAMTHAAVYEQGENIRVVLHAHTPLIWNAAASLAIPQTAKDVAYGTPAMAREIERLFQDTDVRRKRIFAMAGHLDGVISFGPIAQEAGMVMLQTLARAQT